MMHLGRIYVAAAPAGVHPETDPRREVVCARAAAVAEATTAALLVLGVLLLLPTRRLRSFN
jgi:hypothetical protein